MTFARFRSGRIAVVPTGTRPGDVVVDFGEADKRQQDSGCVFRRQELNYQRYHMDLDIDKSIDTKYRHYGDVYHCTYVGRAWTDKVDFGQEITTEGKHKYDPETIVLYAVH
ncbi:predicted protein [Sclerotinia sclerotiorum 1980 UF-70]|uniref:Uncharacterized protein n=2 Tax=Sclerotinia sclerotiorum (strain ATCC 18683 / 1980 / Ss-1) TaxID=665079 RepID=A7EDQ9_SCLS1|nr:predicted protein [Sclerotinia sclerotiorum 1980 UF-70]APA10883.1 hypothetical protein sscle_07g056530 [Sclerotinia sclerotiorum 1980 UF-70]EDO00975.1 predicted protein [Sclerotinia sclerotiorum 1980 UF-70]